MSVTKLIRTKGGKRQAVYRAQIYLAGRRIGDRTFETQAAAYAWHDEEKLRAECGLNNHVPYSQQLSFEDCLSRYLTERFPKLEASTQQARNLRIGYLRSCPLSKLKMMQVNGRAIDQWMDWLLKSDSARCPRRKSFIAELKLLSTVLNWYRDYLDADFVVSITKRHRELARYRRNAPRRPDYFVRPEDVKAWVGWLRGHRNPVYFHLASFMMLTGVRVGEAAGLLWREVDLDNSVARIVRVLAWDQHTKEPRMEERVKSDGSIRIVVLPAPLVRLLREVRAGSKGELVFPNAKGECLKYNAIQAAFNQGFRALNLPWRSTHICRHTFATLALMATRDLSGVQASLGHRSQAVTERYAKVVALLQSGTAEKTAELMNLELG